MNSPKTSENCRTVKLVDYDLLSLKTSCSAEATTLDLSFDFDQVNSGFSCSVEAVNLDSFSDFVQANSRLSSLVVSNSGCFYSAEVVFVAVLVLS